jgi:DNA invertase Pin-like site-specific DNA recombinase
VNPAAIADFERDLIRERTGEGRKRAMANGVKFGRKRKLSEHQRAEAMRRRAAGETLALTVRLASTLRIGRAPALLAISIRRVPQALPSG